MNEFQRVLAQSYANGDLAYISTNHGADLAGDTLFLYLWRELSDCEDSTEAIERLERAVASLEEVKSALSAHGRA